MSPRDGFSRPLIHRSNVVFPAPLGPMMQNVCPACISRLSPSMTMALPYATTKSVILSKIPPPVSHVRLEYPFVLHDALRDVVGDQLAEVNGNDPLHHLHEFF